ncbi:trypsin-like peptidase domain-containing protein [Verrucomicrobiota bacterium sgz303538]
MLRSALLLLLGAAITVQPSLHAADPEKAAAAFGLLRQIEEGFVQVFDKVAPSVVVIETTKKVEDNAEEEISPFVAPTEDKDARKNGSHALKLPLPPSRSEGSGFIIRADGLILTNLHVVNEAEKLNVRFKDGRILPATLLASDDKTDIAVIKVDATGLTAVEWGDSDTLRVGQLVCAIGAPFNQDYSFTAGWVSGKGRTNLLGPTSTTILYEDYIQTDAFINPGNSGGPLFDVEGRIVGMNTLINGIGRGLAFAIPSKLLQQISSELINHGRVIRPWLGIRIESLAQNPILRERVTTLEHGVVVDTIEANAPVRKSQLRPADIITEVDGFAIGSAHDLQKEVLKKKVGQSVTLTVWRNGNFVKVPVITGELPTELPRPVMPISKKSIGEAKGEIFGLRLRDGRPGAVITEILADTPAAASELQVDDVITDIENQSVKDAAACLVALRTAEEKGDKRGILVNVDRKGRRTFAVLNPTTSAEQ